MNTPDAFDHLLANLRPVPLPEALAVKAAKVAEIMAAQAPTAQPPGDLAQAAEIAHEMKIKPWLYGQQHPTQQSPMHVIQPAGSPTNVPMLPMYESTPLFAGSSRIAAQSSMIPTDAHLLIGQFISPAQLLPGTVPPIGEYSDPIAIRFTEESPFLFAAINLGGIKIIDPDSKEITLDGEITLDDGCHDPCYYDALITIVRDGKVVKTIGVPASPLPEGGKVSIDVKEALRGAGAELKTGDLILVTVSSWCTLAISGKPCNASTQTTSFYVGPPTAALLEGMAADANPLDVVGKNDCDCKLDKTHKSSTSTTGGFLSFTIPFTTECAICVASAQIRRVDELRATQELNTSVSMGDPKSFDIRGFSLKNVAVGEKYVITWMLCCIDKRGRPCILTGTIPYTHK